MKKLLSSLIIFAITFVSIGISISEPVQAAGNFYLAPGAQIITNGQTFSVGVRVNTGGAKVDTAQANLFYPADKLDYLGVGYGGTAFEIQAQSSGGGGSVKMGRATLSAKSGDLLVGTITFRAKVSSGSGTVSFTSGTEADLAGSVKVSATSSGTYNFTKPAPAPKPDKTAPKISSVKVSGIGLNTATITWKTNENATSIVEYGLTKNLGISVSNTKLKTSHKLALSTKVLIPGTQIYYKVSSKDKAGNSASSKMTSFKTKGYNIRLKILNNKDEPIKEAKVTLVPGFETGETDEKGIKNFDDIAPGKHSVNVDLGNEVLASSIEVLEKNPDRVQEFVIKLSSGGVGGLGGSIGTIPIIIIFILSALVVLFAWIIKKKNQVIKKDTPPHKPHGEKSSDDKPPRDDKPAPEPPKAEAPPPSSKGGIKETNVIIPKEEITKDGKKIKVIRAEDY
ncbi:MAG: hypothetical protein A2Z11_01125 [Candidatus Woykebacteria bacterium RBG_16_43_9]|uniref:Fibronectin type-III domain-containing protein n=1 Tax=Candidatus Woykebacteria bacterium RBG_16_43_9 TaxID=1802596 RepID=A0A1G1WDK4_9BACT|nr:MAG: hypothetical protein A2Z11_01125 [Candidatus Woykebacteria bacterium RBG_16_43_9]